eukprot:m.228416 g.228416  ORF g.228416 m.228416 type:complete len:179 (+) comp13877_c0_seq1:141-677(+)
MGDRVTQLQDLVLSLSEGFFNAVGNVTDEKQKNVPIHIDRIVQTVKDIDRFCQHLPDISQSNIQQTTDFDELNKLNDSAGEELKEKVKEAEEMLQQVRQRIKHISTTFFLQYKESDENDDESKLKTSCNNSENISSIGNSEKSEDGDANENEEEDEDEDTGELKRKRPHRMKQKQQKK